MKALYLIIKSGLPSLPPESNAAKKRALQIKNTEAKRATGKNARSRTGAEGRTIKTANAFIIDEYKWEGHKQLLLERLQGDCTGYRVIIVKRCSNLDSAKEAYLQEIPEKRQDYHKKIIEDYATKNNIKPKQETRTRVKPKPAPAKGKANDKSEQKSA